MYQREYDVHIEGLSPLIMHWDNIDWSDQIDEERTAIKEQDAKNFKAGDDRCPPHSWKGYVYQDGSEVCLPQECLMACLRKAGARVTLKGKQTYKSLTQSSILFPDLFLKFQNGNGAILVSKIEAIGGTFKDQVAAVSKLGFSLFVKRAKIGQAKHVRVRPKFDKWSVDGHFVVSDDQLGDSIIERIFLEAGLYVGLGDWRPSAPQSPGPFGRFTATVKRS